MIDSGFCALSLLQQAAYSHVAALLSAIFHITKEEAIRLVVYITSIHDCHGKTHPSFQMMSDLCAKPFLNIILPYSDYIPHFRHEIYGSNCFYQIALQEGIPEKIAHILETAIVLHHQGKGTRSSSDGNFANDWVTMRNELDNAAKVLFDPPLHKLEQCNDVSVAVACISSIVIVSDWIASSAAFFMLNEEKDEDYIALSQKKAEETIRQYGLATDESFPKIHEFSDLWPSLTNANLRPLQQVVYRFCNPAAGLTIIEAPMGEGKTEAGAFQAARFCSVTDRQGIYFALPTSATSNQMYDRMNRMLNTIGLKKARLMHGMAWLYEDPVEGTDSGVTAEEIHSVDDAETAYDWLHPMRRALLAQNAVGTIDQAMMAAMPIPYGSLRLLGLTGKVLLIDEIHAYDAYMSSIIDRLLEWCKALQIPVVLLSATLTEQKKADLIRVYSDERTALSAEYPLVTQVNEGKLSQLAVHGSAMHQRYLFRALPYLGDDQAIARAALQRNAEGGCLCVMLNTVKEAQHIYEELKKQIDDDTLLLIFHARFMADDRKAIEENCIRLFGNDTSQRPKKAILVCTQVVEQSIDLDFDGMITAVAPFDLLLQRAGRVFRHLCVRRPPSLSGPVIDVLVPAEGIQGFGASEKIYEPCFLRRAMELLPREVKVPENMRSVIEAAYRRPETPSPEWVQMEKDLEEMKNQARTAMLPTPDHDSFYTWDMNMNVFACYREKCDAEERAYTRLSDCSTRISLLLAEDIKKIMDHPLDQALARQAMGRSFTVNLRPPDRLPFTMHQGEKLLHSVYLVENNGQPIQMKNALIRYDRELGAEII